MRSSPISKLVDLSIVSHNNPRLIAKKAVEYVDRMKAADREISGLSYRSLPTDKRPSSVKIKLKSSTDNKFVDEYKSPETYNNKLTLACFLLSVSMLTNLGNRAHILCTNASGRGDTQMSISTKHPKSKLQEKLVAILNDQDYIAGIRNEINIDLPADFSEIQKDLINQAISGTIGQREINRIKTNHSVDDFGIYFELENLRKYDTKIDFPIPHIDFRSFRIEEVVENLRHNPVTIKLQGEVDSLVQELDILKKEIDRIKSRNLLQRILNK